MTWKDKLVSRKFVLAVATFASAVAVIMFDVELDPLALAGAAGVIMAYMGGQSWVDKTNIQGQADIMKNESLLQAQAYIKYLESELAKFAPPTAPDIGVVPDGS